MAQWVGGWLVGAVLSWQLKIRYHTLFVRCLYTFPLFHFTFWLKCDGDAIFQSATEQSRVQEWSEGEGVGEGAGAGEWLPH